MSDEWYCELEEGRRGPVSPAQMRELVAAGKLKPTTWVWQVGMKTMVAARSVPGLFDSVPAATPAAIPVAAPIQIVAPVGPIRTEQLIELTLVEKVVENEVEILAIPTNEPVVAELNEDADEPEPAILAEASVTYREGLPEQKGPTVARLCVESAGLRFLFENDDFYVPFERIESVRDPIKGDFPEEMKKKARNAKVGGAVGRLASGLLGSMIGDSAGDAVSKVGHEAARAAEAGGDLGKEPHNRVVVQARLRKERRKVRFDVNGVTREEMTRAASVLVKKINKAREKYARAEDEVISGATVVEDDPSEPEPEVLELIHEDVLVQVVPASEKLYRVLIAGKARGPYSLKELRRLLASDEIADDDLISVESWVSAGSLRELFGVDEKDVWGRDGMPGPRRGEGVLPVADEFKL